MQINYPFSIDGRGRVASATEDEHVRQMIEQVIFTIPGERVNRPDFGSGIKQLIFSPNNNELAAATQFLVRGALEQWLGDVIQVEAIELVSDEERLYVTLQYVVWRSQQRQVTQFSREI